MHLNEGQRLKLLADELKRKEGLSREEIANKIGITKELLSTVFRWERLSPEVREKAIRGLGLPSDYFDKPKEQAPTVAAEPPPPEYGSGQMAAAETRLLSEIARLKEENRQLLLRLAEKEGYIASKQATIEDLLALLRERKE